MGLDATTYVLEVINFLVLLWLLRRFLFKPLLAAIRARQEQAEQARQALVKQRAQVQAELREVEQARDQLANARDSAQRQLASEIAAERGKRLQALDADIAEERTKAEARLKTAERQHDREQQQRAAAQAQEFLHGYLARLAGVELERAIIELFFADLAALPAAARDQLCQSLHEAPLRISSAYALDQALQARLLAALGEALRRPLQAHWEIDPELLAGIAVELDGHVLEANLAGGIDAFAAGQRETA